MYQNCVIRIITWVNCHSVKLATQVQNGFMCAKLLAIAVIVGTGCVKIAQGETQYLRTGFENSKTSYGTLAIAFYQGLWAYDGWNNLNYVTEEIKNPNRNLPLSIIIAIPLVTICYVLVNISYLTVMSPSELLQAEAVAVTFGNKVLGVFAWFMPLSVALSTFGAANGTEFTSGRLCYAAAREGHLVQVLSFVNLRRYTPMPALIFNNMRRKCSEKSFEQAVVALIMIIPGDIDSLIEFFSFTAWIFYGGAMAALLVLRRTRASVVRPYKVNLIIPITVLLASIFLVVAPLVEDPKLEYLYATMFIFTGLIFYVPFVYYKIQWGPMEKITRFFQLIMEVVPTDHMPDI
ncbi:unnamed protein product [Cyprideis torosa]|uniref:Uncharacterized protein n=1 Tax=Cyprideis torosa TaxID=163714 RepID=A0A7R8W9P7_9CRUS|nr:unnamed protein product [Cyprideis torosa]CAG0890054.1 unnamed protein product [Cyprideis torosa]